MSHYNIPRPQTKGALSMNMEMLAQIIAVASAFAAAFHFSVLRPLDNTISRNQMRVDVVDNCVGDIRKLAEHVK